MSQHHTHKAHLGAGEWELLYQRPYQGVGVQLESAEFIIRIDDPNLLEQWKHNPSAIPIVDVVDAAEVYITDHSHTGKLRRPSNTQLLDAFNSSKFEDIFAFMVEHGHLQSAGKHAGLKAHDSPALPQEQAHKF